MLKKFSIIYIFYILLSNIISSLEFKKNKNIMNSEKSETSKVNYITSYDEIRKILFEDKKNSIILFYADWCSHW